MRIESKVGWLGVFLSCGLAGWSWGQPAAGKLPTPDKVAQAKALKLIDVVLGTDIAAAKEPEARVKLAAYLLQQGRESKDDIAVRFVLFREAIELAARGGDAILAFTGVDEMARDFDINPLATKNSVLGTVADSNLSKEAAKGLVDIVLPLIHDAIEADNYETALGLGKVANIAAQKSKNLALVTAVQKRNDEIVAVQKGFSRLQAYIDRLKKNPNDAEANLELGKYYGFLKGKWEKAMPLLAMGSDDSLKKLAVEDRAQPKGPKQQLDLADGFWDLAAREKDPTQLALQRRAMHWYEQAVGQLSGLNRTKAIRRIDLVSARLTGSTAESPGGPVGELKKLEGHSDEVKCVTLASDGRYGVSGGVDQSVRVWDLISGKEEKALRGHTKQIWSVAFLNNRQVLSASWDSSVRLWDIKTGAEVRRYPHRLDVNGVAVTRDGAWMATACDDHNVYLWNPTTGEEVRRFPGHTGFVYCVAFSPDGRLVASGSVDKTVRVFDLATGNAVKVFEGHTAAISNVVFSSDSRSVFSSGDGVAHQFDIASGKEVRRFEGHKGNVLGLALSPDGRRLLTGGDDKTIRYWDVSSGKELHRLEGHADTVNAVTFSSDGRRALSGSLDRTVRLWGLPPR